MNPEKQRIAIAVACGWKCVHEETYSDGRGGFDYGPRGMSPHSNIRYPIPDYLSDLNAMHEAEKILTYEQLREYTNQIALVHMQTLNRNDWDYVSFVHIPANERAEAFLRTIGKWEDE